MIQRVRLGMSGPQLCGGLPGTVYPAFQPRFGEPAVAAVERIEQITVGIRCRRYRVPHDFRADLLHSRSDFQ